MSNPFAFLGSADFVRALVALMPWGAAWSRDPNSTRVRLLGAFADLQAAFHARAALLSETESDPRTTALMLSDWETAFGLPDVCTPAGETAQQRHFALLQRMTDQGGQSAAHFIAVAAALGFAVTITNFVPARIGQATCGQPMYGQPWIFARRLHAPAQTVVPAVIGLSTVGDPLRAWGNTELECVINRMARAATVNIFAYG